MHNGEEKVPNAYEKGESTSPKSYPVSKKKKKGKKKEKQEIF